MDESPKEKLAMRMRIKTMPRRREVPPRREGDSGFRWFRGVFTALAVSLLTLVSSVAYAGSAELSQSEGASLDAPRITVNVVKSDLASDPDLPIELRPASVKVSVVRDSARPNETVESASAAYGYTFGRSVYNGFGTRLYTVYERIEWTGTSISLHSCWGTSGIASYRSCDKWTGSGTFGASWIFTVGAWGWPQYDPWTSGQVHSNGGITITFHY